MRPLTSTLLAAQQQPAVTPAVALSRRPASAWADRFDLSAALPWAIPGLVLGSAPIAIAAKSGTMTAYVVAVGQIRATPFAGTPPVQGPTTLIHAASGVAIAAESDGLRTALVTWATGSGSASVSVYVDAGAGFATPETCTFSATVQAASCAWDNAGRLLIAVCFQPPTTYIAARLRTGTNTYAAEADTPGSPLSSTYQNATGIACAYTAPAGSGDWAITASATDPATGLNELRALLFGDGALVPAGTYSAPVAIAQAAAPTATQPGTTFTATGLSRLGQTLRWSFLESFTNTPAGFTSNRTYLQTAITARDFMNGYVAEAVPCSLNSLNPAVICTDRGTNRLWAAATTIYAYADQPQDTDYSARLLHASTSEQENGSTARIVLDNSDGALTPLLTQDLTGQRLTVAFGYQTTAGTETAAQAPYFIAQAQAIATPGLAHVQIEAVDAWRLLALYHPRRAQVWAAGTTTIAQMLQWLLARVSIPFTPPGSPSSVLTSKPAFAISPAISAAAAIHQLLVRVPEVLRFTAGGAVLARPQAGDAPVYSYASTSHQIAAGRAAAAGSGLNHVLLMGRATPTDLAPSLLADSIDPKDAVRIMELPHVITDMQVAVADAQAESDAALRKAQLLTDAGEFAALPNVGLELWDPVALSFPPLGWSSTKLRVRALETLFDRTAAAGTIYSQSAGLMYP